MNNDVDEDYYDQLLSNSVFLLLLPPIKEYIIIINIPTVLDLVGFYCSAGRYDGRQSEHIYYNILLSTYMSYIHCIYYIYIYTIVNALSRTL